MSIKISYNGSTLFKPGAFSKLNVNLVGGFPISDSGIVGIVGEADKGAPGDASGEGVQEFIRGLVAGDVRFFFGGTEQIDENYNYNDNTKLIQAISNGHRGAFWDILRRVEEED